MSKGNAGPAFCEVSQSRIYGPDNTEKNPGCVWNGKLYTVLSLTRQHVSVKIYFMFKSLRTPWKSHPPRFSLIFLSIRMAVFPLDVDVRIIQLRDSGVVNAPVHPKGFHTWAGINLFVSMEWNYSTVCFQYSSNIPETNHIFFLCVHKLMAIKKMWFECRAAKTESCNYCHLLVKAKMIIIIKTKTIIVALITEPLLTVRQGRGSQIWFPQNSAYIYLIYIFICKYRTTRKKWNKWTK